MSDDIVAAAITRPTMAALERQHIVDIRRAVSGLTVTETATLTGAGENVLAASRKETA